MYSKYPWFAAAAQQLTLAYNNERLAHGLLINAPTQSGKLLFAQDLAKGLLCPQRKGLNSACGECKSCHLFNANSHPDYYLIDCLLDNKGNKKKSIGIDQIRTLNSKLIDTAQLNGWRVVVICSVTAMTTASFNALLKTLEEPRDKTLMLLITSSLSTVPATVKSRCQIINAELTQEILVPWLSGQIDKNQTEISHALRSCNYAPLATLSYLQHDGLMLQKQFFNQLDDVLTNRATPGDFLAQQSIEDEKLTHLLADYFHAVKLKMLSKEENLKIYTQLPPKLIFQLYSKVIDLLRAQHSGSNLQTKLQLEAILIQWFEIGRKISHYSNV